MRVTPTPLALLCLLLAPRLSPADVRIVRPTPIPAGNAGTAPGGCDPAFDLIEINSHAAADEQQVLSLPPEHTGHALVVEDQRGRRAYTDPIWVSAAGAPIRQETPRP